MKLSSLANPLLIFYVIERARLRIVGPPTLRAQDAMISRPTLESAKEQAFERRDATALTG